MATSALPVYPRPPVTGVNADSRPSQFMPVFFGLLALQLILPGMVLINLPSGAAVARVVEILFLSACVVYLFVHAGFLFSSMPVLLISSLFLAAGFFVTELLTNQNLLYALFEASKVLAPYFAFMVMFKFAKQYPDDFLRWAKWTVIACYVLSLIGIVSFPQGLVRGRGLAPAYFGGGMHTSAYIICLCGLATYVLWRLRAIGTILCMTLLATTLALIIVVWNVRTTIMLFVAFFAVYNWQVSKRMLLPTLVVGLSVVLMFSIVDEGRFSSDTLVSLSSGRLSMWGYKVELLASTSFLQLLFGQGLGSDLVVSDIWWWAAKDSHNDYLHVVTELGIVGLVLFSLLIVSQCGVLGRGNALSTALISAYLVASLFSNGLMFRPLPSLIFALAMALTALPGRRCESER